MKQPVNQYLENPSDLATEIAEGWDKPPDSGLLFSTGRLAHDETKTANNDAAMSAVSRFQQNFFINYLPDKLFAQCYFQDGKRSK